ncbi:MAG TPA: class I SAM-dependent methyltransferase, partial [Acidimicrobiales bacterium]|nr:class I SAM-dependent methyltransferase [Acidimicrobiales bacterium]
DSWEPALLEAGFEPEDRTVWIAEGLLVYLRSDDRDALLRTAAILSPAGSRLGATVPAAGRRRQLAAQGGGDLWLSDGPEDPTRWLAGLGWAAELFDSRERLAAYGRATPGWDSGGWRPGRPALVSARRR